MVYCPRLRNGLISLGLLLILFITIPAHALVGPPDPFDSTDRYALLIPISDGTLTKVTAKLTAPGSNPLGAGELRAVLRYKITPPQEGKEFQFSASKAVPIQSLSNTTPSIIDFDFSVSPVPAQAHSRTLRIYYQETKASEPVQVAEYRPEQLLLRPSGDTVQTTLAPNDTAHNGLTMWGPVTVIREREEVRTEHFSFTVSNTSGIFFLSITNGSPDGSGRVSSAVVKFNGTEVLRPSELNQNVAGLKRQVVVSSGSNTIDVRLRSAPGSYVTLEVLRLDAATCRAFGPYTFLRSTGKPKKENIDFTLNPQITGPFMMSVLSGRTDGTNRVDSAGITLNGNTVLANSNFNEVTGPFSQIVSLQPANSLSVELTGGPGDQLSVEIAGYDVAPPQVAIAGPASGTIVHTSSISVSGTVDDPYSSVTINGIKANVAPDGTFTAEITLVEGENVVKAVAKDACGNQDEDQITVSYQTVPVGPKLAMCAAPFREQTPLPPVDGCPQSVYEKFAGLVTGSTDDTAATVVLNGVLLPDGVDVFQYPVFWGKREGNFFWAFVYIPQSDGAHPFTAVVTDANGASTEGTVTFVRDTAPPHITILSPANDMLTNTPSITVTGTVDDPAATVFVNWTVTPVVNGTFTASVELMEGPNYIFVSAMDQSFNYGFTSINATLDTIPPQINITAPVDGAAINTASINVAGNVADQNAGTVSVAVNGGLPQELTVAGASFSGTVGLTQGQNILAFKATDLTGNSATVVRTVVLDQSPPVVSIDFPQSGSLISGQAAVSVTASDTVSGINKVVLLVDGNIYATLPQPPFNFQLNTLMLSAGSHTVTARAVDAAGNQTDTSITVSVSLQLGIEITSPVNGASANKTNALVEGNIYYNASGETGVTVNGVLAQVGGGRFSAIVPLQNGLNTITASAKNAGVLVGQSVITVNNTLPQESVRLTVLPASGILSPATGTFDVLMEATAYINNPVSSYSWDLNGDGIADIAGPDAKVSFHYQAPGLYYPAVMVTDSLGNTYTEKTVVNVMTPAEMDAFFKDRWSSMKTALLNGDVEGAVSLFDESTQATYRAQFTAFASILNQIGSELGQIQMVTVQDNRAEYEIITARSGSIYSYYLLFVRGQDGLWKIRVF